MIDINKESNFSRNEDQFLCTEVDGETVMMSTETGEYYGLNGVSTDIWNLMEKNENVGVLIGELMRDYKVDKEKCEKETIAALRGMLKLQMIVEK